jgi:GNAT superfamily N-acetyltransferase
MPAHDSDTADIAIVQVPGPGLCPHRLAQVEAIFFEASQRPIARGPEREAFRERWLGRYLSGGSDVVLLALAGGKRVAGYLVGALENPAAQPRFADLGYLRADFAELCRRFPAHLHINLAPAFRSRGIGGRLIEAFAVRAAGAGPPGMHVVTGEGMRNVGFYLRHGFLPCARAHWNGRMVVFLARELRPPRPHAA